MEIYPDTLQDAIVGDDREGSVVTLTLRKEHTGNIFDVQLRRVSKKSIQQMVEILEQCDLLVKRHSESQAVQGVFGGRQIDQVSSTIIAVEKIRSLISKISLER
jgi:hypothetical protein